MAAAKLFGRACTMQRTVTTKLSLLNMTLKAGNAPALAAAGYLRLMEDLELTEREWRMAQAKLAEANAQLATLKEQHAAAAGLQARVRGRSAAARRAAAAAARGGDAAAARRLALAAIRAAAALCGARGRAPPREWRLRRRRGGAARGERAARWLLGGRAAVDRAVASHALDGHAAHFVVTTRQAHVLHGVALRVAGAVPRREEYGVENGDGDADESGDGDGDGGERPPALGLVAASAYSQSAVDNLYGRAAGGGAGRDADDACVVVLSRLAAPTTLGAAAAAFRALIVDAFAPDGAEGGGALERAARAAVRQPGPRADGSRRALSPPTDLSLWCGCRRRASGCDPGGGAARASGGWWRRTARPPPRRRRPTRSALARLGHAAIGTLLSALLLEQKILLVSGFPSRLTAAEALRALAFPLVWSVSTRRWCRPPTSPSPARPSPTFSASPPPRSLLGRRAHGGRGVGAPGLRARPRRCARPLPPREAAPLRKALQSGGRAAVHAAALPRAAAAASRRCCASCSPRSPPSTRRWRRRRRARAAAATTTVARRSTGARRRSSSASRMRSRPRRRRLRRGSSTPARSTRWRRGSPPPSSCGLAS